MSDTAQHALPALAEAPLLSRSRRDIAFAFAVAAAASVAIQATLLFTPLVTMHIMDGVMATRSAPTLLVLTIAVALGLLLGGWLRLVRAGLLAALAERVGRRMQLQALAGSVRIAVTGDRLRPSLAIADVAELRRLLGGSVPGDVMDLITLPAALVLLWMLHPLFFALAAIVLPVKLVLGILSDRASRTMRAAASERAARSGAELQLWLAQRDAVQGMGLMPAMLRRWAPGWLTAIEGQDAAQRRAAVFTALVDLVSHLQQLAMVVCGAWLVTEGEASPGVMMAAMMTSGLALAPALTILGRWRDWSAGLLAWRRLSDLAAEEATSVVPRIEADAPPGLVLREVSLRPPQAAADLVTGLSAHLRPGEAWLLVGRNGTGKTTLMRAILGLVPPRAGQVLLDGHDTATADRGTIGARIGYLPQDLQLLDGSVMDNIGRFAGQPAALAVAAARQAGAHEMIGRLHRGYDTPAGAAGGLSGGQQRLVALSRALNGDPALVLLDEPEAGLDAAARDALRNAAQAACRRGAVVLLVTHDAAPWSGIADHVLSLDGDGAWHVEPRVEEPRG